MKQIWMILFFILPLGLNAQQYEGITGLIHVPSADMAKAGEARIGSHYLHKYFKPEDLHWTDEGPKPSPNVYLGITPFSWLELSYTLTFVRSEQQKIGDDEHGGDLGYYRKDRNLSVKVRPLKENKWWPSVAIGANDVIGIIRPGDQGDANNYYANVFVALSKHLDFNGHILGAHLSYRWWINDSNSKWRGVVGGITYQPSFQQNLRLIVEYTGADCNIGMDWRPWKFIQLQASLQNGKYFSGGVCFCINLL